MPKAPLTRRQRQILDYFIGYRSLHHINPTLDEVAQHFGVNRVTIFGHVAEMERKGVLSRAGRNISRALTPISEGDLELTHPGGLTIAGTIAAGQPLEANENPQLLEWSNWLPQGTELFLLRVRGHSMVDDAICDGDLVVVEKRSNPKDGEVVVAILSGEQATLKRFYREVDGYRLQPANSTMKPIHVSELEIRGVVVGVLRRY